LELVIGALLLTDRLLWQPGLTEGNVRRLQPGVTLMEVEALLGGPATEAIEMPADWPAYCWHRTWRDGAAWAEASFWADGHVMAGGGSGAPAARPPRPPPRLAGAVTEVAGSLPARARGGTDEAA
jgi:hypothetical protein